MTRRMQYWQYVDPEVIFQFNARFTERWDEARLNETPPTVSGGETESVVGSENVFVIPLHFRKATQTFQWVGIRPPMWHWDEPGPCGEGDDRTPLEHYRALLEALKPHVLAYDEECRSIANETARNPQSAWGRFRRNLTDTGLSSYCHAVEVIEAFLRSPRPQPPSAKEVRALLVAYSAYHHGAGSRTRGVDGRESRSTGRNLEGLLLDVLRQGAPEACLVQGTLEDPGDDAPDERFRWLTLEAPDDRLGQVIDLHTLRHYERKPSRAEARPPRDEAYRVAELFNQHLLVEPERFMDRLRRHLHVLLVPMWDVWLPGPPARTDLPDDALCGTGSIGAAFLLFFPTREARAEWSRQKYSTLASALRSISSETAAAALTRATSEHVDHGHDLIRHFLWSLRHVQDWEAAAVFKDGKLVDGFYRKPSEFASDKQYLHWIETDSAARASMDAERRREQDQQHARLAAFGTQLRPDARARAHRLRASSEHASAFLIWHTEWWDRDYMPDLREDEIKAFGSTSIVFQFPDHAHVPSCAYRPATCDDDLETVADHYLRQQLELMRRLLPKVRARNAALKSAVASIMGRNMSHNIGSHVLARYSGRVRSDLVQAPVEQSGPLDHREDFLRYLQRRMDFIAEVATSERSLWSQPLGLRSVLERLDFDRQLQLLNDGGRRTHQPILLSYVAGKDGPTGPVRATVEIDTPTPTEWHFNCPGGEVGAHALYVILENIIRNSARHNSGSLPDRIALKIKVTEACFQHADDGDDEYWRVTVVDERSMRPTDSKDEDLVARINRLLQSTPVLTPDGALDPHYWGVREMQICAAYLRGVPLSDLEGRPRRPPLVTAAWTDGGRLSYELHVQRARLAIFVTRSPLAAVDLPPGVRLATVADDTPLSSACAAARGYAFAIVEKGPSDPDRSSHGYTEDADWPVRTFFKSREEIDDLLGQLRETGDVITWLDQRLHRETAIQYRMLRTAWQSVAGAPYDMDVLVLRGGGALAEDSALATDAAAADSAATHLMKANPTSWMTWRRTHGRNAARLRLAWVDHLTRADLLDGARGFTDALSDTRERVPRFEFAEGVRSASPHRDAIAALRAGIEPFNELAAAALGRVIVLDERVQGEADKDSPASGLKYRFYWPYWGAWVPSREDADLNAPDLEQIKAFLNSPRVTFQPVEGDETIRGVPSRQLPADFLVVHLTILESLMQQTSLPPAELIRQLRACTAIGPCCRLVVVTGRGVPTLAARACDDGVEGCRYLPISSVFEYLVHNPSKLMLMRALWSAASGSAREGVS